MIIKPYNSGSMFEFMALSDMFRAHNLPTHLTNDLPALSLVVLKGDKMVAFGALRYVEGNMFWMDSFITNPEIDPKTRDEALDKLGTKLIKIAKTCHTRAVVAFSADHNTIRRAERHGFSTHPNHVLQFLRFNPDN